MKKLFACVCALLLLFQTSTFAAGTPDAVLNVRESVVRVVVETPFGTVSGTGFAVGTGTPVQYIITNNHVVENANSIGILLTRDNMIAASVHTALPASDLAILKVSTPLHQVKPVVINDKKAKEGSEGYALGYPGAASVLSERITGNKEDITITNGIISALTQVPYQSGMQPVWAYQINAALNPGNSGGPFVNRRGEVIGISAWGVTSADSVNAAICSDELTVVLAQNGIPFQRASTRSVMWILVIVMAILVAFALVFLILMLIKKNKKSKPVLYGVKGEFAGERFYLPPEGVNIGRDAALCQIVLPSDNPKISRSHCNLKYSLDNKNFVLTDLSSANGTYLINGTQLIPKSPTSIEIGTKFYLGDEATVFQVGVEE